MNEKRYKWHFLIFALFLGSIYLLAASQPAAAVPIRWARWLVDFKFPNNQMDTQLIIQVGHTNQAGKHFIDQQQSFPISCLPVGNPLIQGNQAIFDGSSYFVCSLPSIQLNVAQMTNGTLLIADTCASKQPFIMGNLALAGAPLDPTSDNALFHRQDIQFNLPVNEATQQAQLAVRFDQAAAESDAFNLNSAGQLLTAVYSQVNASTFAPTFTADGFSLASTPPTVNAPIRLSTLQSTIYLGYSPPLGDYFEGAVTRLLVDPVCVGTG